MLVGGMLDARGYELDDPVVREGEERDVVAEFLAAREITRLRADDPDSVSPGDVGAAVNGYRAVYESLIAQAEQLGEPNVVTLLQQNLQVEQHTLEEVKKAQREVLTAVA